MRFDLPDDKKLCFERVIPIRWGDMDAMGHVNNAVYFRYLETLRIDWFRSIGCQMDASGVGPVIINAFCSFIRQLEYPGDVLAKHYTGAMGRSTLGGCRAWGRACVEAGNGLSLGAKHSHAWRHGAHWQRRISPFPASTRRARAIFGAICRCRLVVGADPTPRRRLSWNRNSPWRRPVPKPDSLLDTYATLERVDQPGVIHATGSATVVWIDAKAQKSVPLPDRWRMLFGRS